MLCTVCCSSWSPGVAGNSLQSLNSIRIKIISSVRDACVALVKLCSAEMCWDMLIALVSAGSAGSLQGKLPRENLKELRAKMSARVYPSSG